MSLQGNFGVRQGSLPGVSQLSGLGREGWNQLVASATGPGVNASQAAVNLDPFYRAQSENLSGLVGGFNGQQYSPSGRRTSSWQQAISQATQQYGVNASQAAQMLDPIWLGRGEVIANTPGTQNGGRRSRARSDSQQGLFAAATGYNGLQASYPAQISGLASGGYNGYNGLQASYPAQNGHISGLASSGYNGLQARYPVQSHVMTPTQLGASLQNGRISGLDRESGFDMYDGLHSQSFRAGTPTDVVLNNAGPTGLAMLQAAPSPARITNRSAQYFDEADIARIAQALGIQTQGLNRAAMIAQIKAQAGSLSPRTRSQFIGSQSPRSQQLLSMI